MYCNAIDGFYLKANGELPCWCSPGEHQPMLSLSAGDPGAWGGLDIARDVLNGPKLRGMRRALRRGRTPFSYCEGCFFLSEEDPPEASPIAEDGTLSALRCMQVEPSYLCNVDCPLCVRFSARRQSKEPPYLLPADLFRKTVDDLVRAEIAVGEIWFSGRGEPFMNPQLPALVRYAKQHLGCRVSAHTNGNFRFRPEMATCGLDELDVAMDGVTQETYERYRRRGKLARVAQFGADFAAALAREGAAPTDLVWKTVLFEWNSSLEHLERAVEWAAELGFHRMLLVDTDTPGGISHRDGGERAAEIRAWVEGLRGQSPLPIEMSGFGSVFSSLPDIEAQTRLDLEQTAVGRQRAVLVGRLLNHTFDDRNTRVRVDVEGEDGRAAREVLSTVVLVPENGELVDSVEVPRSALGRGLHTVTLTAFEPRSGVPLSSSVTYLDVDRDGRVSVPSHESRAKPRDLLGPG